MVQGDTMSIAFDAMEIMVTLRSQFAGAGWTDLSRLKSEWEVVETAFWMVLKEHFSTER